MAIQDLQTFIQTYAPGGCVSIDLLKIAARNRKAQPPGRRLRLVLDAECCLDRLYGGFFSDWASGGQWNRMVQFLSTLIQNMQAHGIELVVFFNGCQELDRIEQWQQAQQSIYHRATSVLRHLASKGTPPPKVWWIPPECLRTCLRMALRHLNVSVMCSMYDHRQEVIAFCRENNYHGLLVEDPEYAAFDPPRYFSSQQLKLTYKGALETKEYLIGKVAEALELPNNKLPMVAALLGNHLISEESLDSFHRKICPEHQSGKIPSDVIVKAIASFLNGLGSISNDVDEIVDQVFPGPGASHLRSKLHAAFKYYMNGTKEGFLSYKSGAKGRNGKLKGKAKIDADKTSRALKFASDASSSIEAIQSTPSIKVDPPTSDEQPSEIANGLASLQLSSSSSSSTSSAPSPNPTGNECEFNISVLVSAEVLRTASERHTKGMMSPQIYQILSHGQLRLPAILADETELPPVHLFFRPLRQMVYGVLFNLHHLSFLQSHKAAKDKASQMAHINLDSITIQEILWLKDSMRTDKVKPERVGWGVPTVQRLWFGSTVDDKRRRLRAFLSCMRSDTTMILNPHYVPQPMLLFACVIRYIMSHTEKPILRKQEMDALIAQAFSPELMNANFLQDLQLPRLNVRGVQLAALVMNGIENALLANDACGAPIPWLMCCPWLYFDGKLFQYKLLKAENVRGLPDLCDHRMEDVLKIEKMKEAILEGLTPTFARVAPPQHLPPPIRMPTQVNLMAAPLMSVFPPNARGVTPRGRNMVAEGGRLRVAGIVVGQWGDNYGSAANGRSQGHRNNPPYQHPAGKGFINAGMPNLHPGYNPRGDPKATRLAVRGRGAIQNGRRGRTAKKSTPNGTVSKGGKVSSEINSASTLKTESGLQPNGHPDGKTASLQEPPCP
ncbi:constitutive coactivator of PPAR-gamma-like protein 1 [Neocloeon triangulifer]|uniref:constitutive coactivator of PPAR-gamma-like protein 1 n=1 Tax=Neocloeon triangulifer TaxID=2078957 RepID=UPI00286EF798|nr:constitutive coactivator of PPAR-gamma-like protein 1 [Neocloeon triangulifer]